MGKKSQLKAGVILSYLLLIVNMAYGLLIAPHILKYVGMGSYGVYKTIASLSASLAVLDLGLGSTMTRYMAKYNATDDKKSASNFVAMMFIQFSIIGTVILCVGVGLFFSIESTYKATFSSNEIALAKKLMIVLLINMVLRLFENLLSGIAIGHERFMVANGDYVPELTELVKQYGNVKYLGIAPNSEIVKAELGATLLINPDPRMRNMRNTHFHQRIWSIWLREHRC